MAPNVSMWLVEDGHDVFDFVEMAKVLNEIDGATPAAAELALLAPLGMWPTAERLYLAMAFVGKGGRVTVELFVTLRERARQILRSCMRAGLSSDEADEADDEGDGVGGASRLRRASPADTPVLSPVVHDLLQQVVLWAQMRLDLMQLYLQIQESMDVFPGNLALLVDMAETLHTRYTGVFVHGLLERMRQHLENELRLVVRVFSTFVAVESLQVKRACIGAAALHAGLEKWRNGAVLGKAMTRDRLFLSSAQYGWLCTARAVLISKISLVFQNILRRAEGPGYGMLAAKADPDMLGLIDALAARLGAASVTVMVDHEAAERAARVGGAELPASGQRLYHVDAEARNELVGLRSWPAVIAVPAELAPARQATVVAVLSRAREAPAQPGGGFAPPSYFSEPVPGTDGRRHDVFLVGRLDTNAFLVAHCADCKKRALDRQRMEAFSRAVATLRGADLVAAVASTLTHRQLMDTIK